MSKHTYNSEPNLMMYNFPSSSVVYRFTELARIAVNRGKFYGIGNKLISNARDEFTKFRDDLDAATPHFAHEIADMALGSDIRRKIVVAQGQFEGDYTLKSTIGLDLGTQLYRIYKRGDIPKNQTIDEYIAREAVNVYLREHAAILRGRGIEGFRVRHSAFFSFRDADLKPFRNSDGNINMRKLLPLVADTILIDGQTGYIGINQVDLPEEGKYVIQVPPFTSNRIKSTLARKLARRLSLPKIKEEDVVTDTGAHRIVVASMEQVRDLERRIRDGQVGKSTIKIIPEKTKDYYRRPKGNKYMAVKLVTYVTTKGGTFVREIQLVDVPQYYNNEINSNDPAHHRRQEKKEELPKKQLKKIPEQILEALQTIFGKSTIYITLKEALKS